MPRAAQRAARRRIVPCSCADRHAGTGGQGALGRRQHRGHLEDRQAGPRRAALRRPEAVAAMDARRARQRLRGRPGGAGRAAGTVPRRGRCSVRYMATTGVPTAVATCTDPPSLATTSRQRRISAPSACGPGAGGARRAAGPMSAATCRASACSSGSRPLRTSGVSPCRVEQRPADLDEALGRPAPRSAERARTRHQQHGLGQLSLGPARRRPPVVVRCDAQLESRLAARMPCAEHADDVEAVVDLVAPAEAVVDGRVRQEPSAAAVVEPDAPRRAAAQAQRGVLGDAERRGQVMQQDQRVPAARPQAERASPNAAGSAAQRVRWTVEGELVEGDDLVVASPGRAGPGRWTASSAHRCGPRESSCAARAALAW